MRLPDRIWVPAAIGLALAVAFIGVLLVRADGDESVLVHAGPPWTDSAGTRDSLTVQAADDAFDGQFFYRIGTAPWSTAETENGVTFDLPALRNARWGYGALAWVASGGDPDLVPWTLIGLNVIAAAAVGAIGGGLARTADRHAAWGTLFVLWPGFAYSLSLDTSELVASAFLLGGLLALRHRRWVLVAALLTAAVLTRDTTTVVPFAVTLAAWGAGSDRVKHAISGAVPLGAFAGWQLLQQARFGELPLTSSGDNNLTAPLSGLVDQVLKVVPPSGSAELLRLVSIAGLVALIGAAAWGFIRTRTERLDAERLAWLGAVAVVLVLNAYLWSGATAFMRAATEAGVLSMLVMIRSAPRRLLAAAGAGLTALWLITVVAQASKLG